MRYEVAADGSLANGQVFFDMTGAPGEEALDGIKVDEQGNLYVSGPGGVWILSPEGKHLGTITAPEHPHNFAWGDADGKTLYMTARTGIYRIRLKSRAFVPYNDGIEEYHHGERDALRRHHHRHRRGRRDAGLRAGADRASGSCSWSAATTCRARRRTGTRAPSSPEGKYNTQGAVARPGRQGAPPAHATTTSGGNTKFYGAALFRLRQRGLRRGAAPRRRLAGVADRATTSWSRTTPQAEQLYHVHGERGEDPTEPPASAPYPLPGRSATSRASRQLSDDLAAAGLPAVPRAARRACWTSRTRSKSALHPLRHLRRASLPGQRQGRRAGRAASTRRCEHPNVTLLTNAYVVAAGDRARRAARSRASSWSATACSESYSADVVVVVVRARSTRRRCCCARPTTSTRSGLANGSDVVGRHYMGHVNSVLLAISQVPEPDGLPEDARR